MLEWLKGDAREGRSGIDVMVLLDLGVAELRTPRMVLLTVVDSMKCFISFKGIILR